MIRSEKQKTRVLHVPDAEPSVCPRPAPPVGPGRNYASLISRCGSFLLLWQMHCNPQGVCNVRPATRGVERHHTVEWVADLTAMPPFVMMPPLISKALYPPGNYPRLPGYGGPAAASYGVPGSGVGSSPMHGQGPGQPCGSMPAGRGVGMTAGVGSRPYPGSTGGLAPGSPGMPQPSGPGMGRPQPSGARKSQEVAVSAMQAGGGTTTSRWVSVPVCVFVHLCIPQCCIYYFQIIALKIRCLVGVGSWPISADPVS